VKVLKMADKLLTPEACFAFVYLFEKRPPMAGSAGDPKYAATLIFDAAATKTPQFAQMQAAVKAAVKEKFGDKVPAGMRNPFRKNEERSVDGYKGFPEGGVFINVTSTQRPGVIDRKMNEIIDPKEIYSGFYGRASLSCYAYDKAGNKGVAFGLNNVQKIRDGESLGGRSRPTEDFQPLGDDAAGAGDASVDSLFS
jgi:hypothetical protein